MRIISLILFFSVNAFSQANFDQRSFLDLNVFANEVQKQLYECAEKERISISDLYKRDLSICDHQIQTNLKNLKDSFKLFTLSSIVEEYGQIQNEEKISPLLIQFISEKVAQFRLDQTTQGGGKRGIGLCLGPISIGICAESPAFEISPEIQDEHMAYLRLFEMIPASQCDLGLFPQATVTLLHEIADAQGLVGQRARNNVIVKGDTMIFMVDSVNPRQASTPATQLIRRLDGKFFAYCALMPARNGSATSFFRQF